MNENKGERERKREKTKRRYGAPLVQKTMIVHERGRQKKLIKISPFYKLL